MSSKCGGCPGRSCFLQKLKDLVSLRIGYTFRNPPEPDPSGNVRALLMRDVSPKTGINPNTMVQFRWDVQSKPSFIEASDVLLLSRAQRNSQFYAVLVPQGLDRVVASSHFFVLQVQSPDITPEYLQWYLNFSTGQKYLATLAAGTGVLQLSIASLRELPVEVPDSETQRKIIELQALFSREEKLTFQLMEMRQTVRELIFTNLLAERTIL